MARKKKGNSLLYGGKYPTGKGKSVTLFVEIIPSQQAEKDLRGVIVFQSPILREDFRNGSLQPRAYVFRQKNKIKTCVSLSKEALYALRALLMRLPPYDEI